MKRFVTYLYEYENGHKRKNAGFLRVDIRNQMVSMQVSIRYSELADDTGALYIIVRDGNAYSICIGEIQMKGGQYQGVVNCRYQELGESPYSFIDAVGVGLQFQGGCYLASSWKDEEDEVIAKREYVEYGANILSDAALNIELAMKENDLAVEMEVEAAVAAATTDTDDHEDCMEAAEAVKANNVEAATCDFTHEETRDQDTYRKINLNEIATLPSSNWYFSNNSFLIHGFWNYGYLVLKETFAAGEKKLFLGVPGIFEQPEMVMATYFGFSTFEALPPQVVEMVIGESCQITEKVKNQEPKVGTFGCWFVNL